MNRKNTLAQMNKWLTANHDLVMRKAAKNCRALTGHDTLLTHKEMLNLAKENPPPQEWFDEEHETLKTKNPPRSRRRA